MAEVLAAMPVVALLNAVIGAFGGAIRACHREGLTNAHVARLRIKLEALQGPVERLRERAPIGVPRNALSLFREVCLEAARLANEAWEAQNAGYYLYAGGPTLAQFEDVFARLNDLVEPLQLDVVVNLQEELRAMREEERNQNRVALDSLRSVNENVVSLQQRQEHIDAVLRRMAESEMESHVAASNSSDALSSLVDSINAVRREQVSGQERMEAQTEAVRRQGEMLAQVLQAMAQMPPVTGHLAPRAQQPSAASYSSVSWDEVTPTYNEVGGDAILSDSGAWRVYRARYGNADVVVKELRERGGGGGLDEIYEREMRSLPAVGHPHVVRLLGTITAAEGIRVPRALLLEYVPGGTLQDMLRNGPHPGGLGLADAVRVLSQVAGAMSHIHARSMRHGDLQTSHVLVEQIEERLVVKITGFGLSRLKAAGDASLTFQSVGSSPGYCAPEALDDENPSDRRADVYSFGMVAYEVLSGKQPFEGKSATAIVMEVMRGNRPDAGFPPVGTPPELVALIRKCWDAEPGRRPTFQEIVLALSVGPIADAAARARAAGTAGPGGVADEVPEIFLCPILSSREGADPVMRRPVTARDGHNYEESALRDWVRLNGLSPLTNVALSEGEWFVNYQLQGEIEAWRARRERRESFQAGSRSREYREIIAAMQQEQESLMQTNAQYRELNARFEAELQRRAEELERFRVEARRQSERASEEFRLRAVAEQSALQANRNVAIERERLESELASYRSRLEGAEEALRQVIIEEERAISEARADAERTVTEVMTQARRQHEEDIRRQREHAERNLQEAHNEIARLETMEVY